MSEVEAGVYAIINMATRKVYIGCSINVGRRIIVHFSDLKARRHGNRHLQSSYNKHAGEFIAIIVEAVLKPADLREAEQRWIDRHQAADRRFGFNIVPDSQHKMLSPETRHLMSESHRGKPLSDEHKNNIRIGNIGISKPRFKKPRQPKADPVETFAKISRSLTGHPVSKQTRALIGGKKRGRPLPKRCVTNSNQRDQIRELAASKVNNCEIGRRFGISRVTVRNIVNAKYLYDGERR